MSNLISSRQFDFSGSHEALTPLLKQILNYINGQLPALAKNDDVFFRYKIIITELLTNAIKHSGGEHTVIGIQINEDALVITKADYGKKFDLLDAGDKISASPEGLRKTICSDPVHVLYAVWESRHKIHFECKENDMADPWDINDMMEHFGLLIITKSADTFFYTYDERTGANLFTVNLYF
jgi:two-component sensor histidine kinase